MWAWTLCLATLTHAALPPLSPDRRQVLSQTVITGTVQSIASTEETSAPGYSNLHFTAQIKVHTVHKSALLQEHERLVMTVKYWSLGVRPAGWAGS